MRVEVAGTDQLRRPDQRAMRVLNDPRLFAENKVIGSTLAERKPEARRYGSRISSTTGREIRPKTITYVKAGLESVRSFDMSVEPARQAFVSTSFQRVE